MSQKFQPGDRVRITRNADREPDEWESAESFNRRMDRLEKWKWFEAIVIGDGEFENDTYLQPVDERPDAKELGLSGELRPFNWLTADLELVED